MGKGNRPGRQEAPRKARRRFGWGVGAAVGVVVVAVVGYFAYRAVADLPGTFVPSQGNAHVQLATDPHPPYNSAPPTPPPCRIWRRGASTPSPSRRSSRSTTWRTAG